MKRLPAKAIALQIIAIAILSSCNVKDDVKKIMQKYASRPVEVTVFVQTMQRSSGQGTASYVGTVEASRTDELSASNSGTVTGLCVKVGDRVRKGQTLAVIESESVRSAYSAAVSSLNQAQDGWDRIQKVRESRSVTEVKVVEVQTKLEQARSAAAAASERVENMTIKAHFDGIVAEVYVSDGVQVNPTQCIARIVDLSSAEIHFPLPENEYSRVAVGTLAEVDIPALARTGLQAMVTAKGAEASKLSRSYDCTLSPRGAFPAGVMPGMVCKISLRSKGEDAFVVPSSAVMTDMQGRYVWTADEGVVDKRYIVVDGYSGKGVVVTEGLKEGCKVIVEGSRKVSTGMKVKTVEK